MIIAIDYDQTYAAAFDLWDAFVCMARQMGHTVIIVTGRKPEHRCARNIHGLAVIYADGKLKRDAAEAAGIKVDIWIDDEPGTVERCRLLEWPP